MVKIDVSGESLLWYLRVLLVGVDERGVCHGVGIEANSKRVYLLSLRLLGNCTVCCRLFLYFRRGWFV